MKSLANKTAGKKNWQQDNKNIKRWEQACASKVSTVERTTHRASVCGLLCGIKAVHLHNRCSECLSQWVPREWQKAPSSIFFLYLPEVAAKVINPACAAAALAGQRITVWQRVVKTTLTWLGMVMRWDGDVLGAAKGRSCFLLHLVEVLVDVSRLLSTLCQEQWICSGSAGAQCHSLPCLSS